MPAYDAPDPLGPGASPVRTVLADDSTGRRLVWSLSRFVARQPRAWKAYGYLALGVLIGATLAGLDADPEQDLHPYPALWALLGGTRDRRRRGRPKRAADHRRTLLPLPLELVGDDLDRVRQLIEAAAAARAPSDRARPSTAFVGASRLPHVLRYTASTGRDQYHEFRRRRARGRLVALTALALVGAVAVAVLEPSVTATVVAAWLGARAALWLWAGRSARAHVDHSFPAARWFAAGFVGDDLVIEHPTGRRSLFLRGLRVVRERPGGVLVASVSGETIAIPHGVLPAQTVARLHAAARRPGAS